MVSKTRAIKAAATPTMATNNTTPMSSSEANAANASAAAVNNDNNNSADAAQEERHMATVVVVSADAVASMEVETEDGNSSEDRSSAGGDVKREENDVTPFLSSNSSFSSASDTPRRDPTVIIFDWDDTLLPSSWLAANDLRLDSPAEVSPEHRAELEAVEEHTVALLERALTLGDVHLVTNAETGWIELSSEKFMPRVARMLPRLTLVSARSKFEPLYPNNPSQWKIEAFRETLRSALDLDALAGASEPVHILSFGDSHHERQALHVSTAELRNAHVKSVKFVERPEMHVIRRELEILTGVLEYIISHPGDLDLMLSPSLLFSKDTNDMQDLLECTY